MFDLRPSLWCSTAGRQLNSCSNRVDTQCHVVPIHRNFDRLQLHKLIDNASILQPIMCPRHLCKVAAGKMFRCETAATCQLFPPLLGLTVCVCITAIQDPYRYRLHYRHNTFLSSCLYHEDPYMHDRHLIVINHSNLNV